MNSRWHILTGEYPPQPGGVADYTRLIAHGLADAGDEVVVWAPRWAGSTSAETGITVRRLSSNFGPGALAELDAALTHEPGRVLLQYTPHAFGCKAMNVPLCAWLWARGRTFDVMFHEVAYPFLAGQPLKHRVLASVQRGMASLLIRSAARVFVSVPRWGELLRRLAVRFPEPMWSPVPSNLPADCPAEEVAGVQARLRAGGATRLVGSFGNFGPLITSLLEPALIDLLQSTTDLAVVLMGRGGQICADGLRARDARWSGRIIATGGLGLRDAALHVAACDVLVQPYPDGISSRRTTAMAALALGRAVVANEADSTEPIWRETGAVELAAPDQLGEAVRQLLENSERRAELARRGRALYQNRFAVEHTIAALRAVDAPDRNGAAPLPKIPRSNWPNNKQFPMQQSVKLKT